MNMWLKVNGLIIVLGMCSFPKSRSRAISRDDRVISRDDRAISRDHHARSRDIAT